MVHFVGDSCALRFARYPGSVWFYFERESGLAISPNIPRNKVRLELEGLDCDIDLYWHYDAAADAVGLRYPFAARLDNKDVVWKVVVLAPTHALASRERFTMSELLDQLPSRHLMSMMVAPARASSACVRLMRTFARDVVDWCAALEQDLLPHRVDVLSLADSSAIGGYDYLLPAQVPVVERALALAARHKVSINMSLTGAGKSTMCAAVAKAHPDHRVTILAPLAAVKSWRTALDRVGIAEADIYTYSFLSTHEVDWTDPGDGDRPPLRFVIVDECHSIKNPTSKVGIAVMALLATDCKALMVSATLSEGFTKKDLFYLFKALNLSAYGFHDEVIHAMLKGARFGYQSLRDAATAIIRAFAVKLDLVIEHQQEHVLQLVEGAAAARRSVEAWQELYRYYREKDPEKAERLRPALEGIVPLDDLPATEGTLKAVKLHFTNMHRLNETETAYEVARVAREHLESGRWVVVVVNFVAARQIVASELLSRWRGASIEESGAATDYAISEFQAGRHQVIIGTYSMLKQSRDLDDQLGTRPTTMVRTPVASSISDKQAIGRVERISTKSRAINVLVCARGTVEEHIYQLREDKRDAFFN